MATTFSIDFMRWRKVAAVISTVLVLASITSLKKLIPNLSAKTDAASA